MFFSSENHLSEVYDNCLIEYNMYDKDLTLMELYEISKQNDSSSCQQYFNDNTRGIALLYVLRGCYFSRRIRPRWRCHILQ